MALPQVHAMGAQLGEEITQLLKRPLELEYENVYVNFCIFSKKRYAALKYLAGDCSNGKFASKGLSIVRRDVCEYVKSTCKGVLERVVMHRDVEGAVALARARVDDLLDGKAPIEELCLSKKLGASYASEKQPHLRIRDLKIQRGVAPPAVGDRVDFVYVDDPHEKEAYRRVDYIEYLKEHPLIKVDYVYYYNNALRNPLLEIVKLVKEGAEEMFPPCVVRPKVAQGQKFIDSFFKAPNNSNKRPMFKRAG